MATNTEELLRRVLLPYPYPHSVLMDAASRARTLEEQLTKLIENNRNGAQLAVVLQE